MAEYFPNAKRGFNLEDTSMFISPWSQTFDDEQFFMETMKTVGQVLIFTKVENLINNNY